MNDVIVAVDDPGLRDAFSAALRQANLPVRALPNSRSVRDAAISPWQAVILETNDDIAALTQRTYELYERLRDTDGTWPGIIAIVSRVECSRHPALGWWEIHGHAAVAAVMYRENADILRELVAMAKRLLRAGRA